MKRSGLAVGLLLASAAFAQDGGTFTGKADQIRLLTQMEACLQARVCPSSLPACGSMTGRSRVEGSFGRFH